MDKLILAFCRLGFAGLSPIMPGTCGSALAGGSGSVSVHPAAVRRPDCGARARVLDWRDGRDPWRADTRLQGSG